MVSVRSSGGMAARLTRDGRVDDEVLLLGWTLEPLADEDGPAA
jgi:hypothetical protein